MLPRGRVSRTTLRYRWFYGWAVGALDSIRDRISAEAEIMKERESLQRMEVARTSGWREGLRPAHWCSHLES